MPRIPKKACERSVPMPDRPDHEAAATTSRRPSPIVASVRIAEVGDEMLRVVRARAREKLVRAVREATELGTSPLREEISRLHDQLRDTDARIEYLRHQLQHVERRNLSLA